MAFLIFRITKRVDLPIFSWKVLPQLLFYRSPMLNLKLSPNGAAVCHQGRSTTIRGVAFLQFVTLRPLSGCYAPGLDSSKSYVPVKQEVLKLILRCMLLNHKWSLITDQSGPLCFTLPHELVHAQASGWRIDEVCQLVSMCVCFWRDLLAFLIGLNWLAINARACSHANSVANLGHFITEMILLRERSYR